MQFGELLSELHLRHRYHLITYLPNRISDTGLPHEHDVQAARPVRAEHDRLLDVAGT